MSTVKTSVLLINLGSPEAPEVPQVRAYLKEFLSDKRVIEISDWIWKPILYAFILRKRPAVTALKYQSIWTEEGAPLLVYTRHLAESLQKMLDPKVEKIRVDWAMRYGFPSIDATIKRLHQKEGVEKILLVPLYPQYSATTTATVMDVVGSTLASMRSQPEIRLIRDYHRHPSYIQAITKKIQQLWKEKGTLTGDARLVLSFHGMPQSYSDKGDPYRNQCETTAELIRKELGLDQEKLVLSYQSRFGKEEWLKPYTDRTLEQLACDGVRRVDILCPGFSADCLETLEEINQEVRDIFLNAGGKEFNYITCLNDDSDWVKSLSEILTPHLFGWID